MFFIYDIMRKFVRFIIGIVSYNDVWEFRFYKIMKIEEKKI